MPLRGNGRAVHLRGRRSRSKSATELHTCPNGATSGVEYIPIETTGPNQKLRFCVLICSPLPHGAWVQKVRQRLSSGGNDEKGAHWRRRVHRRTRSRAWAEAKDLT